jgi:hypothetical protein
VGKKLEAMKILKHEKTMSGGQLPKENLNVTAARKRSMMNCGGEKILKEDLNCCGSILKEEKQGTHCINDLEGREARKCGGENI